MYIRKLSTELCVSIGLLLVVLQRYEELYDLSTTTMQYA